MKKYKIDLSVTVPASAIGPGIEHTGRHLGIALGVGEITDTVIRLHIPDATKEQKDELCQKLSDSEFCRLLRNGPNAIQVKSVVIDSVQEYWVY